MQYESELLVCKRKNKIDIKKQYLLVVFGLFLSGVLISRVVIFFNDSNIVGIAPFGIAYLMSVICRGGFKNIIAATSGVAVGYVSIFASISDKYITLLMVGVLILYSLVISRINKKVRDIGIFTVLIAAYLTYGYFIQGYEFGINITLTLLNIIVIIPVYYVIKYGVKCIEEFNSNYYFDTEDILSIGIILCLVIAGIGRVSIEGVGFRNIFAYMLIILVAYIGGSTYGGAFGISMGVIVGLSFGDAMESIALYSLIGLISGIFKENGKIFVMLAYIMTYIGSALYLQNLNIYSITEVVVAGGLFLAFPNKLLKNAEIELDIGKKKNAKNEIELSEIKGEFADKIKGLGIALNIVSETLENMTSNQTLMYKNKSAALIENLTNRVCIDCIRARTCWDRDFNITYKAFEELIRGCEENRILFPHQLEKTCEEKFQLIKSTDSLVTKLRSNEIMKDRLEEGRLIVATHLKNVANSLDEMFLSFKKDVSVDEDLGRILMKGLNKNSIYPKNIFCYRDINGRIKIKFNLQNCDGSNYCNKVILTKINEIMNVNMSISEDSCKISPNCNDCSIIFEETPNFNMISYGAMSTKTTEEYSGDSYSFGKDNNGRYITIISDGMGSGPQAARESLATVNIIEKYIEVGFNVEIAINMVNAIMAMKFEEDEEFSTLDLNVVDLYSGEASFTKIGGVASFVKRGKSVKTIMSNIPPFGLVDKIEIDKVNVKLKNGDIIIMVSDGVIDINKNSMGDYSWIEEYLKEGVKDPKKLAQDILEKAKQLSDGKPKDDMTVVVSKVSSVY